MKIRDIFKIIKQMGLPWVTYRGTYEIKKNIGLLKRQFPTKDLSNEDFINTICLSSITTRTELSNFVREQRRNFFFTTSDFSQFREYLNSTLSDEDKRKIIEIADNAIEGKIFCFSRWTGDYGHPLNWHLNPINEYEWPSNIHWVDLEELSPESGDVKLVWEASRFPHFFYFIRAYVLTGEEKYAKAYWEQIEHWIEANPYQVGINWKCGQEVSFRIFAWLFGLYAFLDSEHTTVERIFLLIKSIYYGTIRVERNINFAIKAVQNNHAISEAACLFTVGTLFPFLKDANRFKTKGQGYLEEEGMKQIYKDGSYIQNSMNYHRLMLQVYTWVLQLAKRNKVNFSSKLESRVRKAIEFLYEMQDDVSGCVPNYGANDGALIFPLSSCDYLDYRPQLNTINYILNGEKLYKCAKHDEDLMWFCGLDTARNGQITLKKRTSRSFDVGGYYTFRGKNSFGMVRCARIRHRSGSPDILHFDLWYKGVNVLADIGSYSYNPDPKYRGYFGATKNHNTLTVNDMNQSRRGPRFLSLDGSEGFVKKFSKENGRTYFEGYHTGYGEFTHTRKIEYKDNSYIITDEVENPTGEEIKIRLNWNINTDYQQISSEKYRLIVGGEETASLQIGSDTGGKVKVYYANETLPGGWKSEYYGKKQPINQLVYEVFTSQAKEKIITAIRFQ